MSSTARAWGPGYGNDRRPTPTYGGFAPVAGYGTNIAFYAPPNIAYLAPNIALLNGYGGYGGVAYPGYGYGGYVPYGAGFNGGYRSNSRYQGYQGNCNWGY